MVEMTSHITGKMPNFPGNKDATQKSNKENMMPKNPMLFFTQPCLSPTIMEQLISK